MGSSINNLLLNEKINIKNKYENYTSFDTFYNINNELLEPINTKDYKIEKKRLKVESLGQPISDKIKITIPKLKMESIKKLQAIKEESEKDELTEKRDKIVDYEDKNEIEDENEDENEAEYEDEEEKKIDSLEIFEDKNSTELCLI